MKMLNFHDVKNMSEDEIKNMNEVLGKGQIEKRFWYITDKIMAYHDRHYNLKVDNELNEKQVALVDMLLCNIEILLNESEKIIKTLKPD